MSGAGRYRVVGVLPESALADVRPGTVFERMAFDLRARVLLEAVPGGFVVRHEGFKKIGWEWRGGSGGPPASPAPGGGRRSPAFPPPPLLPPPPRAPPLAALP